MRLHGAYVFDVSGCQCVLQGGERPPSVPTAHRLQLDKEKEKERYSRRKGSEVKRSEVK